MLCEGTSEKQKGKNTITDGGSTVMHSKAIIGLDWILLRKLPLSEYLAVLTNANPNINTNAYEKANTNIYPTHQMKQKWMQIKSHKQMETAHIMTINTQVRGRAE